MPHKTSWKIRQQINQSTEKSYMSQIKMLKHHITFIQKKNKIKE
jgi:hypothetical protein